MKDPVSRYLRDYAEPEAQGISPWGSSYSACVVVPAFNESSDTLARVWQNLPADALVIVVVNSPREDDPSALSLLTELNATRTCQTLNVECTLAASGHSPDLLLVDRFSQGRSIPPEQGVGLARKTGCDIALRLIEVGVVALPWLFTTDADTELPADYFSISTTSADAALIQPFYHDPAPGITLPVQLYEIGLLYYAAGLDWAGSPYAYTTVGSTLTFSPEKYAQVRGFPRRNAAEDFYLLNKLAKLGGIRFADTHPVCIAGRLSDRVPVGTGPALTRINSLQDPLQEYRFEHPDCFGYLRSLLAYLELLARDLPDELPPGEPWLTDYVRRSGISESYLKKRLQAPSPEVMARHLTGWFDALKTRQLIHHARDTTCGTVPFRGLADAAFLDPGITTPAEMLNHLRQTLGIRR